MSVSLTIDSIKKTQEGLEIIFTLSATSMPIEWSATLQRNQDGSIKALEITAESGVLLAVPRDEKWSIVLDCCPLGTSIPVLLNNKLVYTIEGVDTIEG